MSVGVQGKGPIWPHQKYFFWYSKVLARNRWFFYRETHCNYKYNILWCVCFAIYIFHLLFHSLWNTSYNIIYKCGCRRWQRDVCVCVKRFWFSYCFFLVLVQFCQTICILHDSARRVFVIRMHMLLFLLCFHTIFLLFSIKMGNLSYWIFI